METFTPSKQMKITFADGKVVAMSRKDRRKAKLYNRVLKFETKQALILPQRKLK